MINYLKNIIKLAKIVILQEIILIINVRNALVVILV
jgi:hypothetical protein